MPPPLGHVEVLRYLVEQGADKDKVGNIGITALMAAAISDQLGVARYLVEQGMEKDKTKSITVA